MSEVMARSVRPQTTLVEPSAAALQVLQALRLNIDEQDLNILRAIEQRGRIVEEILMLKQSAGLPAFDAVRERHLLERLHAMHGGPYQWQDVEQLFRTLLAMSRALAVPAR